MFRHPVIRLCLSTLLFAVLACALPVPAAVAPAGSRQTAPATPAAGSTSGSPVPSLATPAHTIDSAQLKQGLDTTVPGYMRAHTIFACSLAVVAPDPAGGGLQTQYFNYGTLSRGSSTPVDSTTEYEIGSITKLFTADLLALNVQNGLMQLDDPLQSYLPANVQVPAYDGKTITLSELSTHTSGLPRTLPGGTTVSKVNGVSMWGYNSEQDVYHFLNTYKLTRAPGAKWEYSNLANGLLGMAEEQVGKSDYESLVVSDVAGPLGMQDTRIVLSADEITRLAQGYEAGGAKAPGVATQGATLAAGALRSTTHDMAIYLADNIDPSGTPLAGALQLTQQQRSKGPAASVAMGLGWLIAHPGAPDELFNKDGSTAGYNAYIAFSRTQRRGFVLLCNGHPINGLLTPIEKLLGLLGGADDANE